MEITVRDGRTGHALDSDGKGAVLATFDREAPLDEGDVITLADGDKVMVIGLEEKISDKGYWQTVYVGSMPG